MIENLTATVAPFSSVVGSAIELRYPSGALVCTLALMNVSDPQDWMTPGQYQALAEDIAAFVADKINGGAA